MTNHFSFNWYFAAVCVFIPFNRKDFSHLQWRLGHTWVYGSTILCYENYCGCFCQAPSSLFLRNWQRVPNPPILARPSTLSSPIFKFCITPLAHPPLFTAFLLVLILWLNEWSHHIWCVILLNEIMDLNMPSLRNLVPERPYCVFYATRCQVYWSMTHNVIFCWHSDLTLDTETNSMLRANSLTHPYKYINNTLCVIATICTTLNE